MLSLEYRLYNTLGVGAWITAYNDVSSQFQNIDFDTTYSLVVSKFSVHYENSLGHTKHNFMVVSNNIVNALCELYLSLKSAKVIL